MACEMSERPPKDAPTTETARVGLAIHAVFDAEREAVGVKAVPSEAFEAGTDPRAMIETLATISAKANFLAADVIRAYDADDARRRELYEHFASLKENMLNDMLRQQEAEEAAERDA